MYPASRCDFSDAAGPNGVRRLGLVQSRVLDGTFLHTGFSDPVSRRLRQTSPCPLSLRSPRNLQRTYAAAAGEWQTRPRALKARTIRAILLASATRTNMGGLRVSILPNQGPGLAAV